MFRKRIYERASGCEHVKYFVNKPCIAAEFVAFVVFLFRLSDASTENLSSSTGICLTPPHNVYSPAKRGLFKFTFGGRLLIRPLDP